MNYSRFLIHGNADHDGIADSIAHLLAFIEGLLTAGDNGHSFFSLLLPGIANLSNYHPLFVHFPIAFISLFFLIEMSALVLKKPVWRDINSYMLYFATISCLFTVLAGFLAAHSVAHGDDVHEIMENHEHLGISILLLNIVLSVWRFFDKTLLTSAKTIPFTVLSVLLFVLLLFSADLGGLMVYRYGVAVQAVPVPANGYSHHHHDD